MSGDPRIGVAIITRNRCSQVLDALDRLEQLPERPKVVVVDNASSDATSAEIARQFPEVTLISVETNLGAAGRNVAVAALDRPYIGFCDDDTWWEAGSLKQGADLLEAHPRLAVITARVIVEPSGREDPTCQQMQASPLPQLGGLPGHRLLGFLAGASVVRRAAFVEAGGFPTVGSVGGEEEWLAVELVSRGWALSYVPELCIHHAPCAERNLSRRRWQQLRNALWFLWLRRPLGSAVRRTLALAQAEPWTLDTLHGFGAALAGLPQRLPQRKVVTDEVEQGLRLLEQQRDRLRSSGDLGVAGAKRSAAPEVPPEVP